MGQHSKTNHFTISQQYIFILYYLETGFWKSIKRSPLWCSVMFTTWLSSDWCLLSADWGSQATLRLLQSLLEEAPRCCFTFNSEWPGTLHSYLTEYFQLFPGCLPPAASSCEPILFFTFQECPVVTQLRVGGKMREICTPVPELQEAFLFPFILGRSEKGKTNYLADLMKSVKRL